MKNTWKLGDQLPYINRGKKGHVEVGRRAWNGVLSKPHHQHNDAQGIMRHLTNLEFLPNEWRLCTPHQAPKLLRLAMIDGPLKHLALKRIRIYIHETQNVIVNWTKGISESMSLRGALTSHWCLSLYMGYPSFHSCHILDTQLPGFGGQGCL